MAINWKLKTYLVTKHSIYTVVDLKKKISKKTGVVISRQNLSNMINKRPNQIRLETMELICSALNCELSDFLQIKEKQFKNTKKKRKLSYKNTPNSKRSIDMFPSAEDYE